MVSVSRAWREPSGFLACVAVGAESIEQNPRKRGSERALPYHCTPKGAAPENVLKVSGRLQVQASAAVKFGARWSRTRLWFRPRASTSARQVEACVNPGGRARSVCKEFRLPASVCAEPLHRKVKVNGGALADGPSRWSAGNRA